MVDFYNNKITAAYTEGKSVQYIFSNGVQVFPSTEIPDEYERVNYIYAEGGSAAYRYPYIPITNIPWGDDFRIIADFTEGSGSYGKAFFGYITGPVIDGHDYERVNNVLNMYDNGWVNRDTRLLVGCLYNEQTQNPFWDIRSERSYWDDRLVIELNNYEFIVNGEIAGTRYGVRQQKYASVVFMSYVNAATDLSIPLDYASAGGVSGNLNRWYGAKIMRGAATVYNLVPVKVKATGEYGFFDTVNGGFYGKQEGAGGSIKGA